MEELKEKLIEEVKKVMASNHPEIEVKVGVVAKNNGTQKESITFMPKNTQTGVAPTVYIADAVDKITSGQFTILDAAQFICDLYESSQKEMIAQEVNSLFEKPDYSKILPEVINADMNRDLLANTPHRMVAPDIAMIARYHIVEGGTCVISDSVASKLCLTAKEVLDFAEQNAKNDVKITDMADMLAELMNVPREQFEEMTGNIQAKMIVVSNSSNLYGASSLFTNEETRQEIFEKLGGEYYILPSSIHECICISTNELNADAAREMVVEVNASELSAAEILSNNVYTVSESLKIKLAGEDQVEKSKETLVKSAHM